MFRSHITRRRKALRFASMETLESRQLLSALTWSIGASLPAGRDHAIAVSDGGSGIYLLGGSTTTVVHQYTSGLSAWTSSGNLDLARKGLGAARGSLGIVAYGGMTNETLDDGVLYDPYLGDNQDINTMHVPRYLPGSAGANGKVYAIGGIDGSQILSSVEAYNASADAWSYVAPLPTALYAFPVVADGAGHFLTFGGATTSSATSVSSLVYRYDVAANSWSALAPLPTAVREAAAALGSDGFIYVMGGATAAGATSIVQRYDPAADTWATVTPLPAAIKGATAVTDSEGRLELIGGLVGTTPQAAVYVSQRLNLPDSPPAFTSTAPTKGSADKTYTYQVAASGNPLPTFSLITAPAGMVISPTGLVTWNPTAAQVGSQSVVIRATNAAGSVDQSFAVSVILETTPPSAPPNVHVTGVTTSSISLAWDPATDNTAVASYNIYYRHRTGWRSTVISYALVGSRVSTSFTVTGLPGYTSKTYVVRAVDTSGNISVNSNTATGTTYSLPTLSLYSGGSPTVSALHTLAFSLYSSANPKATFSLVSGPAGMTVDPDTGLVKWTAAPSDIGTVPAHFRATNVVGSTDLNVNITVVPDVPVLSYTLNPGGPPYASAGTPMNIQLRDFSLTPSTYSIVSGPSGMTIDPVTGLASWTPTPEQAGATTVVFGATNSAGSANLPVTFTTYFTGKPGNITASNITASSATISWAPPADASNIAGYVIQLSYRYRIARGYSTRSLTFNAGAGATSVNVTGLTLNKAYTPSVYAIDAASHPGERASGPSFVAQSAPSIPPPQAAFQSLPVWPAGSPVSAASAAGLATVAVPGGVSWNVSFSDPDGTWSAYYDHITRMIQAAGAEWGRMFDSTASIEIVVGFDPALASADARSVTTSFLETDANGAAIYEQGAATEINTGIDPNGGDPDIELNLGVDPASNFLAGLWFDPDPAARTAPVPPSQIDATSVFMHEIGHAIGFNGWTDPATGLPPTTYASTFDQYVYASDTGPMFSGGYANLVLGHDPALTAGDAYHWSSLPSADLMASAGFVPGQRYDISPLDVAVMKDIGMTMDATAPAVTAAMIDTGNAQSLTLAFSESVRASLDPADLNLLWISPAGVQTVAPANMLASYDRTTNVATITFPGLGAAGLGQGQYVLTLSAAGVADLAGNTLPADAMFTFTVGPDSSNGASLTILAGTVQLPAQQPLQYLVIAAGATACLPWGVGALLSMNALTINPGGMLDLGDGDMVINYTGPSPIDDIRNDVLLGRIIASGNLFGAIAQIDNNAIGQTVWHGRTVSDGVNFSQALIQYTYPGDTNLDGIVTQADYVNVIANMGHAGQWLDGDIDQNGVVNTDDLAAVSANLGAGAPLAAGPQMQFAVSSASRPAAQAKPAAKTHRVTAKHHRPRKPASHHHRHR